MAAQADRRERGAYYTPAAVGEWLATELGLDATDSVLDPACGAGDLLLAALRAGVPWSRLAGLDIDPLAVALAQARLALAAGLDRAQCERLRAQVRVADALATPWPAATRILTNPPFLSRLRSLTATSPALAARIRARHGELLGPYADISAVFLADCLRHAAETGIVLPASVFATRDAAGLRDRNAPPVAAWTLPTRTFPGVAVPLVAAVFRAGGEGTRRMAGQPPRPVDVVRATRWSAVLCVGDPIPPLPASPGGTLGDIATVEADFRDEYYALRGHVVEGGDGLRVITSGLVEPGWLAWGLHPAKIHGSRWYRPTVPRAALHPRQARRLGPQVIVATQTRVLEAAADPGGLCVGLTPVLVVSPRSGVHLATILATLLSPAATAWGLGEGRGTGLALDAIKLSASQLRDMPAWPVSPRARALAERLVDGDRDTDTLLALGAAMSAGDDALLAWWKRRLGGVPR